MAALDSASAPVATGEVHTTGLLLVWVAAFSPAWCAEVVIGEQAEHREQRAVVESNRGGVEGEKSRTQTPQPLGALTFSGVSVLSCNSASEAPRAVSLPAYRAPDYRPSCPHLSTAAASVIYPTANMVLPANMDLERGFGGRFEVRCVYHTGRYGSLCACVSAQASLTALLNNTWPCSGRRSTTSQWWGYPGQWWGYPGQWWGYPGPT